MRALHLSTPPQPLGGLGRTSRDKGAATQTSAWRKVSLQVLERDRLCTRCGGRPSEVAHHMGGLRPRDPGGQMFGTPAACAVPAAWRFTSSGESAPRSAPTWLLHRVFYSVDQRFFRAPDEAELRVLRWDVPRRSRGNLPSNAPASRPWPEVHPNGSGTSAHRFVSLPLRSAPPAITSSLRARHLLCGSVLSAPLYWHRDAAA